MATNGSAYETGSKGAPIIEGTGGADTLFGTDLDDAIEAHGGADTLYGGIGNDFLNGGAGADRLFGGDGADVAVYSQAGSGVTVFLAGQAGIGGDGQGDILAGIEDLAGSAFADRLVGDALANLLSGGAGNDTLQGEGGDDILEGGAGADRILGGAAADTATYAASSAGVTVTLDGPAGTGGDAQGDVLNAVEWVIGSTFNDRLTGNHVSNRLFGGDGDDRLFGAGGNDVVDGGKGDDTLDAGDGDDQLVGGAGADRLLGGTGVDTASYAGSAAGVTLTLDTPAESGGAAAGEAVFAVEWVIGSSFADQLTGNHVSNRLYGGGGNDTLYGGDANDLLEGGAGSDGLFGGAGSFDMASYSGSAEAVTVDLAGSTASAASGAADLLSGLENVTGSTFNDILIGDGTLNQLDGGAGNDTLMGGAGADRLLGGAGVDTATYAASNAGVTVILDGPAGTGGASAGDVLYYIEWILGSAHDDVLIGNVQSNRLYGGDGADTLVGGAGNDVLEGGDGFYDVLEGGDGHDVINGGASYDLVSYAGSSAAVTVDLLHGTGRTNGAGPLYQDTISGVEDVAGSSQADLLIGNGDANILSGGAGDDTLQGGDNNDFLRGGEGDDRLLWDDPVSIDSFDGGAGFDRMIVGGIAAALDTVSGIEEVIFTSGSSSLFIDDALLGSLDIIRSSVGGTVQLEADAGWFVGGSTDDGFNLWFRAGGGDSVFIQNTIMVEMV